MSKLDSSSTTLRTAISLALAGAGLALPVHFAAAQNSAPQDSQEIEEVVVTGFRASLNAALHEKRDSTAAVDSIVAEDIGKFPDSNLAESMQRVPGVTLSRSDGGEGRNISVRGLGPGFTRVRINGMEGAAQTGSSDIYGAGNNGRSFDFNVFPTEIFSSLSVRKTPSADVEEGSLGATVDLKAPRPFDNDAEQVFTFTTRGIYNSVSQDVDPRASALFSKKFNDDTFGLLASVAYQKRNVREVGYSAVDVLSANTNANDLTPAPAPARTYLPYCTPIGWTATGPSPAVGSRGSTATTCSTNNPRTSDPAAFQTVYDLRRADLPNVPGSGAFLPRLPRYVNSEQDTERTGGTLSMQWVPSENTTISLDTLYSRYEQERRDNYILGLSLGRALNNNGQPMVSVRQISFDDHGSVQTATFDGMDIRSEGLVDDFSSTFKQINLTVEHNFSDNFKVTATGGRSLSVWDGPMRLQTFMDAIDRSGFTLDFSGGRETPLIGFGMDVSNPANFTYAPTPDGNLTVLGGFSIQGKPSRNVTANTQFELTGDWKMNDTFALKGGLEWREANFKQKVSDLPILQKNVTALPAGVTLADITHQITGLDDLFGAGAPSSWVAIDSKKWRDTFNFPESFNFCGFECGANRNQMLEEVTSAYAMLNFKSDSWLPIPVRGDIGVRYVHTRQSAIGTIPLALPMGSAFASRGFAQYVEQDYNDVLPSMNVVFELTPDLLARVSASKVMSRVELGSLTPSTSFTATTQNATVNNPYLEPIRANTADLALEWYFSEGSLLSVAYFYKDIKTYVQRITGDEPWANLGLPDSLLLGTPSTPASIFHVNRLQNTEGGPLNGFELNAQLQFKKLPGIWSNFGLLANYTQVKSEIEYILASVNGVPTVTTKNDLVNLSPKSASGTLYYEDEKLSIRTTGSYRDKYIRAIPASLGSDIQGNKANLFVDASASYHFTDNFSIIVEAQNLTDERNTLYIDSVREDTLFQTEIGRTYTIGANFKF
ncbi:MAG: TonB-dependent receptor [Pseudomonadota bacterium]